MARVPSCAAFLMLAALTLLVAERASAASAGKNVGSVNFTLGGRRFAAEWNTSAPSTNASGDTLATRRSQPALGIETSWGRSGWPALVAVDVLHSYDDGVQEYPPLGIPAATVRRRFGTLEIGLGARRAFQVKGITPDLGAGVSWIRGSYIAEMDTSGGGVNGQPGPTTNHVHWSRGMGFWVGGGVYRRLGPRFQIGLSGRFSKAKLVFPERGLVRGEQSGYRFVDDLSTNPLDGKTVSPHIEAGGRHIGLILGWSFPSRP